eukprot:c19630_g1_i3.p1 GENE.c19630_g1_i3~~c19630_g1_i3.p1  ORF type:complete len:615 (+),score=123.30 c19630_g1_i3:51-1847(+)
MAGPDTKFAYMCEGITKIQQTQKREKKLAIINTMFNHYGRDPRHIHAFIRLLVPEFDKERRPFGIKDKTLVNFYMAELQLNPNSADGRMLQNWKEKACMVPGAQVVAGDLYSVLAHVLKNRCFVPPQPATIRDVNTFLDNLHQAAAEKKDTKFSALRAIFRGLSDVEQVFLTRIILSERGKSEMKMGLGSESILKQYHPNAVELYNVCHKLRIVCEDPEGIQDIGLHLCVKPMLATTKDPVEIPTCMGIPDSQIEFILEPKMDGERLQIHYDAVTKAYSLFSRNAKDYTDKYGTRLSRIFMTYLHSSVQNIILDGELLTYDKETKQYLKFGHAKTIAALDEDDPRSFCYVAFDILYLNGENLMSKPLAHRRQILETVVISEPTLFQVVSWQYGKTDVDVTKALESYCEQRFEGVLVKRKDSPYVPGQRKTNWIKVKPEYVMGMYDQLDCVILGGYWGEGWRAADGGVSHFLVGLADETCKDSNGKITKFHVLTKVGTGYTYEELKSIRERLRGNLQKLQKDKIPNYIHRFRVPGQPAPTIEWPDQWVIDPHKSLVLEIKAAEITETERMPFGFNLRFPRVTAIRTHADKPPNDATTGQ